jgi:hypothetical protein
MDGKGELVSFDTLGLARDANGQCRSADENSRSANVRLTGCSFELISPEQAAPWSGQSAFWHQMPGRLLLPIQQAPTWDWMTDLLVLLRELAPRRKGAAAFGAWLDEQANRGLKLPDTCRAYLADAEQLAEWQVSSRAILYQRESANVYQP